MPAADAELAPQVTADLLGDVLSLVPDEWLEPAPGMEDPAAVRAAYVQNLLARLAGPRAWLPGPRRAAGDERPLVGYQYVVLRCVPRVDRDEFLNVGVVLYSQAADFLRAAFAIDPDRLRRWHRTSTSPPSRRPCAPSRRCARATARPACRCFPGTAPASAGSAPREAP